MPATVLPDLHSETVACPFMESISCAALLTGCPAELLAVDQFDI
jgi:hypothetical protein